jgi:hypothetical protein
LVASRFDGSVLHLWLTAEATVLASAIVFVD